MVWVDEQKKEVIEHLAKRAVHVEEKKSIEIVEGDENEQKR